MSGSKTASCSRSRRSSPDVAAVLSDVPFLCAFEQALEIAESEPYCELTRYLKMHRDQRERVFETPSYFDGVAFARRLLSSLSG